MPDPNQDSTTTPIDPDQIEQFRSAILDMEGYRPRVYTDTRGFPTVGIGHRVVPADNLNLGDEIGPDRIESLFQSDATKALNAARTQANSVGITDSAFVPALASVNFQLGPNWNHKFRKTWAAMASGDYPTAAMEAARSNWMQQSPKRVRAFQDALLALPQPTDEGDD